MRKGRKELVNSTTNLRKGNHNVVVNGDIREFYYFDNLVCEVNDKEKTFHLDDCGYDGYSSTTSTLNDYRYHFGSVKGYKEI